MKRITATLAAVALPLALLAGGNALAGGGHGGHGHFHHGGHSRVFVGIGLGAPLFWPWYYPAYYPAYYPPAVVAVPSSPPVYVEQGGDSAAPSKSDYWYYCPESKGYYPYVKECPKGWQRVAPEPPPG